MAPPGSLPPPSELAGYVLGQKLGEGGMGAVFRATHPRMPGAVFAVKVLLSGSGDKDSVARFRREMEALAVVSRHKNVVRVHAGDAEARTPFLVMELVQGGPLSKLIGGRPLEPARAVRIVRDVADAIAFAHSQKILHRDLKPDNVLIESGDRPRVCDFGLAVLVGQSRLTQSQVSLGTATYSATEQLDGRARDADERSDVYALGGILYCALTGRPPFEGRGLELLKAVLIETPKAPSARVPGVPRALDLVCAHALEKDPEDRYPSAAAFRDDLDRFLEHKPVSVHELTPGEKWRRALRRHRRKILGGLGLFGAAIVLLGALALRDRRQTALSNAIVAAGAPHATSRAVSEELAKIGELGGTPANLDEARQHLAEALLVEVKGDPHLLSPRELKDAIALLALPDAAPLASDLVPRLLAEHLRAHEAHERALRERAHERLGADDVARLVKLARDSDIPENFLGPADAPVPLGDGLVDARQLDAAAALVPRRLARDPGDRHARWLDARIRLARVGAPSQPLGEGRLDGLADVAGSGVADPDVLADLEAASTLQDETGARAAWLRAELFAVARASDATVAAAVDQARKHAVPPVLAEPTRWLGRALEASTTAPEYVALAGEVTVAAAAKKPGAIRALGVFLARCGLPAELEDPGLAERVAYGYSIAETPASVVAKGPAVAGWCPLLTAIPDDGAFEPPEDRTLPLRERLDRRPRNPIVLRFVAKEMPPNLRGVAYLLLSRETLGGLNDVAALTAGDAGPPSTLGEVTAGHLAELEAEEKTDPYAARLREIEPLAYADAKAGLAGLWRVAEIDDLGFVKGDQRTTRDALVFAAFSELAALDRLGGPLAMPYRARLRRLAFPGALGDWLARVELERMVRLAAQAEALNATPAYTVPRWHAIVDWTVWFMIGAYETWVPTGGPSASPELEAEVTRLVRLGAGWLRENAASALSFDNFTGSKAELRDQVWRIAASLSGTSQATASGEKTQGWAFAALARIRGEPRGAKPTPFEVEAILKAAKLELVPNERMSHDAYTFLAPDSDP